MRIKCLLLRKYIPEAQRRMTLNLAWRILTSAYCDRLTLAGACPLVCHKCKPHLENIFQLESAKNPIAYLHYRARTEAALVTEAAHETVEPTELAAGDTRNPFSAFLENL
jgi:hypothetical protein